MSGKKEKGKRQPTLLLSLPEPLYDEIQTVAAAQQPPVNAQELFRRAAVAVVRCHHELGEVPMDMRIVQRMVDPRAAQFIAEYEAKFGPGSWPPPTEKIPWGQAAEGTQAPYGPDAIQHQMGQELHKAAKGADAAAAKKKASHSPHK